MIKKGFTLAEVLITLAIIGVVAALTAPALVKNTGNAQVGPTLAKVVSSLEVAHEQILYDAQVTRLSKIGEDTADYLEVLSRYIAGSSYEEENVANADFTPAPADYSGGDLSLTDCMPFRFSDTITLYISRTAQDMPEAQLEVDDDRQSVEWNGGVVVGGAGPADISRNPEDIIHIHRFGLNRYNAKGSFLGRYAKMYVDINGMTTGPNVLGQDIFFFVIDNNGKVIPVGSKTWAWLTGGANDDWLAAEGDMACNENVVGNGKGCAGSIFDNNLRVIY